MLMKSKSAQCILDLNSIYFQTLQQIERLIKLQRVWDFKKGNWTKFNWFLITIASELSLGYSVTYASQWQYDTIPRLLSGTNIVPGIVLTLEKWQVIREVTTLELKLIFNLRWKVILITNIKCYYFLHY